VRIFGIESQVASQLATGGGNEMADHGEVEYATADGNDYAAHEATYVGFIKFVKVSVISLVVLLVLMAYFLV
jgi:hypothetical protein